MQLFGGDQRETLFQVEAHLMTEYADGSCTCLLYTSEKVNTYLATMPYVREPKGLYAPIEYVLSLGGKRIRPVLMLLSYQLYKGLTLKQEKR